MTEYHAIIIGSFTFDYVGRPLGPYRLRTACKKAGYNVKVIDFSSILNFEQMFDVLENLISETTIVLGISSAWFTKDYGGNLWFCQEFFDQVKVRFPKIKLVSGGSRNIATDLVYYNCDWRITGYADISFPLLLDKLSGKQVNLKFMLESSMKKVIHSDDLYPVQDTDEIETELEINDKFLSYQPFTLEVSRGCIFKCKFCSDPFLGKKSYEYIRSAESLARELKRNYELFRMTRYNIADSTFNDSIEKLDIVEKAIELSGIPKFEFVSYIRAELLVTKPEMIPRLKRLGIRGYHIGLESLGKEARKVVGKGLDVNRVLDSVRQLNQETGAFGHCSVIVGLPGDTVEDFAKWKEFFLSTKFELFRSWHWLPLGFARPQDGSAYSEFEKYPEKYGYTLVKNVNMERHGKNFYEWSHESGMNLRTAVAITNEMEKTEDQQLIGGWDVATAWFSGYENNEMQFMQTDQKFFTTVRSVAVKRAMSAFKKITKKTLTLDHLKGYVDINAMSNLG